MRNLFYLLFTLITFTFCWSQDSIVKGKIIVETNDNDGITITNLRTKITTISNGGGYFKIKARENDTIMFSAIHLIAKKHLLTADDLKKNFLLIKLAIYTKQIKEIMITNADAITAESLGLVPKGQKKYTPAERRLKTAGDWSGTGIDGALFSLDPFLNWISGRTKQLKKELEIERKEYIQFKIKNNFSEDYFISALKIPVDYVNGFIFYITEDRDLLNAIKAKNKTLIQFRLSELATLYKKQIETTTIKPAYENEKK